MESTATKVWFGQSKRATLFEGTCFKILLLIFACFLETASQLCGKVTYVSSDKAACHMSTILDVIPENFSQNISSMIQVVTLEIARV